MVISILENNIFNGLFCKLLYFNYICMREEGLLIYFIYMVYKLNLFTMKKIMFLLISFPLIIIKSEAKDLFALKDSNNLQTALTLQKAGYLTNSLDHWEKSIEIIEKEAENNPDDPELTLHLAQGYLGLLNTCIAHQDEKTFNKYDEKALDIFQSLEKYTQHKSEALAWQGALYGWKIAFSPMKGMFLGPKSQNLLEKALQTNSESAEALVRQGSSLLFTPEMFGGDPQEAVEYYKKGIAIYEKNKSKSWLYLDALAWLGQAYQKTGQLEKAKNTYEKALQVESKFYWVKNSLLPNLK